jgi:hypothetical protein
MRKKDIYLSPTPSSPNGELQNFLKPLLRIFRGALTGKNVFAPTYPTSDFHTRIFFGEGPVICSNDLPNFKEGREKIREKSCWENLGEPSLLLVNIQWEMPNGRTDISIMRKKDIYLSPTRSSPFGEPQIFPETLLRNFKPAERAGFGKNVFAPTYSTSDFHTRNFFRDGPVIFMFRNVTRIGTFEIGREKILEKSC